MSEYSAVCRERRLRGAVVMTIPRYDFNWQLQYQLETPLKLPGTVMFGVAHFDNSAQNRYNPAPDKQVYWSEQSWDEMILFHIEVSVDEQALPITPQ